MVFAGEAWLSTCPRRLTFQSGAVALARPRCARSAPRQLLFVTRSSPRNKPDPDVFDLVCRHGRREIRHPISRKGSGMHDSSEGVAIVHDQRFAQVGQHTAAFGLTRHFAPLAQAEVNFIGKCAHPTAALLMKRVPLPAGSISPMCRNKASRIAVNSSRARAWPRHR